SATVVHVNNGTTTRAVTLDLSDFGSVDRHATVTPVVSSADGGLVKGAAVPVTDRSATLVVPAKSVTTFLVNGVAGVAKGAALVQPSHVYRLQGVQSGKSLAPSTDGTGVVIRTTDSASASQLWSVTKLTDGNTDRERYAIVSRGNGKRLAVRANAAVLEPAAGGPDPSHGDTAAQWIMSTTGDGTWTYVNVGTGRLLDVGGQATGDGSPVSTFTPTSGANQRWTVVDETVVRTQPVETYTVPGVTPTLPDTVTPVYRDGARGSLPVVWTMPPASSWAAPGTVTVSGTATDPLGRTYPARAVVTVDVFTATRPGRAKTYVGGQPVLPATVVGIGENGGTAQLPATWDPAPAGAFDDVGVVTLTGTAQVVPGTTVDARVRVQVTEPTEVNAALDAGVTASATFTESGYSPDRLRNGDLADKGWSNWKSGTKDPSDTVTLTLPRARDLTRVVTYFYRDGGNVSFPQSMKVQVQLGDGSWVDASGDVPVDPDAMPAPVVDVPVATAAPATGVRVVMTARPGGYITASEIQIQAKAPGVSSDAAAETIEVDGVPIAGFDPDTTTYQVAGDAARSTVTATPRDPYATVSVKPDASDTRTVVVTVTSEDGSQPKEYRVTFVAG
ncbi:MAG TPA: RICIN domain-containing protein, partial [Actinopolymorphaceae bacterium]|nr:RICIN domain-containing protein [Actinopolymorphaceae bacterium]